MVVKDLNCMSVFPAPIRSAATSYPNKTHVANKIYRRPVFKGRSFTKAV